MTCFFPPDCYCTRLPRFMLQARNAPGVALRTVLQLANRIISYVQDIRKSFLLFLYFRSSPILLVVVGYRNLWLIQSLKGSFGATITLSERCLWSTLGAGHVQLCLSFPNESPNIHKGTICTELWDPSAHFSFFGWGGRDSEVRSWREGWRQTWWRGWGWTKACPSLGLSPFMPAWNALAFLVRLFYLIRMVEM